MSDDVSSIDQLRDELELQLWLGKAELRNPSLRDEVSALAAMRDELRLQAHLGRMEAREEFDRLEDRWQEFKNRVNAATEPVGDDVRQLLSDIRAGYRTLRGD